MRAGKKYSTNSTNTSTYSNRKFSLNIFGALLNKQQQTSAIKVFSGNSINLSFNPLDYKNDSNLYYPYVETKPLQKTLKHSLFWILSFFILLYFLSLVKPLNESIERAFINIAAFSFMFYLSKYMVATYYESKQFRKWILLSVLIVSLAATVRALIEVKIIGTTLFSKKPFNELSLSLKLAQYGFYLVIGHIFFLFFSIYNISKIKSTLEHRLSKYKLQHTELKLRLLNAQLDPHFLFNTLNSIYAISILDNQKTPELILKLSEILRFITQNSQLKRIPFSLEVEQTKNFLELFRLRNHQPLNVFLDIDDNLEDIHLMPMTLLTLVENAVKYGNLTNESAECFIDIKIKKTVDLICITVSNSYSNNSALQKSTGQGNQTLRERLEFEYPDKYRLTMTDTKNLFTAELKITV